MTAILRDAPPTKIPQLTPVETRPLRHRGSANSYGFLKSIERIHISDVEIHNGVAYYVIDVYVNKSQIPTIREMRRAKLASANAGKVPQSNKTIRYQRTPDFQVLHRALTPVSPMLPEKYNDRSRALMALKRVESVAVRGAVERDGRWFHVIDVFFALAQSHIPSRESMTRSPCVRGDVQVLRRYSEFGNLRHEIHNPAC
ncbi:hypothetical protein P43SY_004449 [Pythium insidiosum]|uniref:Uncharacterized protein n=1 Tax=Pythium insidiosum TaxID=114742 RepID=A0AAD5LR19_PYTIN|nr:hypothetical protein P43SY_004449 [Pythium insidiosum]